MGAAEFAIIELMGHQRFGAEIHEIEFCGVKLLRCNVLTDPPYGRDVHPQALYAITRCSGERAKLACRFLVSATLMPSERVHAALPEPQRSFDDAEPDGIPFDTRSPRDNRPQDPEEDDDAELNPEEFECEQCKSYLAEIPNEGMYLPEGWAGVPDGWSLIARGPDDDVYFCSESCVRGFMAKPPADEESIEITGPLVLHPCDEIGHWYQIVGTEHGTGVKYVISEGPAAEMRHVAEAIDGHGGYRAGRCAVVADGERVRLWAPHLTKRQAIVPLAIAGALAAEIWNAVGEVGERRPAPAKRTDGES